MPYILRVKDSFSAAHALRGYGGVCERLHGHNFDVTTAVEVSTLNDIGMGIDFKDLGVYLKDILKEIDHVNLNEYGPFVRENATAENIARFIASRFKPTVEGLGAKLVEVTVEESKRYGVTYIP